MNLRAARNWPYVRPQRQIRASQREIAEPARYPEIAGGARGRVHGPRRRFPGYTEAAQPGRLFRSRPGDEARPSPGGNFSTGAGPKGRLSGPEGPRRWKNFPNGGETDHPAEERRERSEQTLRRGPEGPERRFWPQNRPKWPQKRDFGPKTTLTVTILAPKFQQKFWAQNCDSKPGFGPKMPNFSPKTTGFGAEGPKNLAKTLQNHGSLPMAEATPETVYVFEIDPKKYPFQKRTQSLGSGSPPQNRPKTPNLETKMGPKKAIAVAWSKRPGYGDRLFGPKMALKSRPQTETPFLAQNGPNLVAEGHQAASKAFWPRRGQKRPR